MPALLGGINGNVDHFVKDSLEGLGISVKVKKDKPAKDPSWQGFGKEC